jgi:hypothetical protein
MPEQLAHLHRRIRERAFAAVRHRRPARTFPCPSADHAFREKVCGFGARIMAVQHVLAGMNDAYGIFPRGNLFFYETLLDI